MGAQLLLVYDVTEWPSALRAEGAEVLDALDKRSRVKPKTASGLWTNDTHIIADAQLRAKGRHVQADAIAAARAGTGIVSREDVYKIGGYLASRTLKGFTRPCRNVVKRMKAEGLLPEDASELLMPIYTSNSWSEATGFKIPGELVA